MKNEFFQPSGRDADLGFWASSTDLTYWLRHPSVDTALLAPAMADDEPRGADLKIWLKSDAVVAKCADDVDSERPARAPDIELFGEGFPDVFFLERCPNLEHFTFSVEGIPDETYPRGWWAARLWIAPEA